METFTLDPCCWRIGRIFGRNPLLRCADRIEALVTLIALVVSLVAVPVAGVVGAIAYNARWHAVGDVVGTALSALLFVGLSMRLLVLGVRSRLNRTCDAQWEREIRCMQEDGGRTNQR